MELNFRSDNESPAAPEVLDAVNRANRGTAWSYAEDPWSERLDEAFTELFGVPTTAIPLSTGTAANSIALACVSPPWGAVYCHREAHIYNDECGAPEFFGDGLRLVPLPGAEGKLEAATVRDAVRAGQGHGVHGYEASALSLTQSTESGTVYTPDEVAKLCGAATEFGMTVHMDGARFANAVASLGRHPADCANRAGVKLLSFGASKNGCLAAEALLIFGDDTLGERAERLRKRSGHLLSKMRFVSAQLLAYIEDGLWLRLAANANAQAARFAASVREHPDAKLEFPVEANEVFVRWTRAGFDALRDAGIQFYIWPGSEDLARFVFSHATADAETTALCDTLARATGAGQ